MEHSLYSVISCSTLEDTHIMKVSNEGYHIKRSLEGSVVNQGSGLNEGY